MTNDESVLLERASTCDADALGELYDRYAPFIYAYLYRRLGEPQLAEDMTGEVFLRVLQAVRSARPWNHSFRAWLYRIAHNLVVDHYRRQPPASVLSLDEELAGDQNEVDAAVTATLSGQRLRAAVARLTPEQQQVLTLRFGEQLSAREIGELIGKSVSAVEALQHRALAALRRILNKD